MSTKLTSVELQGGSTVDMALPITDNTSAIPNTAWVQSLLAAAAPGGGSVTLLGGLIIKWGLTAAFDTGPDAETFPVAFPTACFSVMLTQNGGFSTTARQWMVTVFSAAGFSCRNDGTGQAYWLAVGH